MTFEEVTSLLYLAKMLYPRDKSFQNLEDMNDMARAWAELLEDVPFELGKAALKAHGMKCPFAPAISDIRDYARRLTEPERLTPEEAWHIAHEAIRKIGWSPYPHYPSMATSEDRARANTPPEVWHVMELLGYRDMCLSENTTALRAQFMKAWERQGEKQQRQKELQRVVLPAAAANLLTAPV